MELASAVIMHRNDIRLSVSFPKSRPGSVQNRKTVGANWREIYWREISKGLRSEAEMDRVSFDSYSVQQSCHSLDDLEDIWPQSKSPRCVAIEALALSAPLTVL